MQHPAFEEVTEHHHIDDKTFKKRVVRTTILLSIVTIVEVMIGLLIFKLHNEQAIGYGLTLFLKGVVVILTLAKAYYIVAIFMHLGDEIRNFSLTIVLPCLLFIWFIIAFLYDGDSYKKLRNTFDKSFEDRTMPKHSPYKTKTVEKIQPVEPNSERQ